MDQYKHGALRVRFVINNVNGNDVVLNRAEAVTLRHELDRALKETGDIAELRVYPSPPTNHPPPAKKPVAKTPTTKK